MKRANKIIAGALGLLLIFPSISSAGLFEKNKNLEGTITAINGDTIIITASHPEKVNFRWIEVKVDPSTKFKTVSSLGDLNKGDIIQVEYYKHRADNVATEISRLDPLDQKVQEKLGELKNKVNKLREDVKASGNSSWSELSDALGHSQEDLDKKWEQFKNSDGETWEAMKAGLVAALDETNNLYLSLNKKYYVWSREQTIEDYSEKINELNQKLPQVAAQRQDAVQDKISTMVHKIDSVKDELGKVKENPAMQEDVQKEIDLSLNTIGKIYEETENIVDHSM